MLVITSSTLGMRQKGAHIAEMDFIILLVYKTTKATTYMSENETAPTWTIRPKAHSH